MLRGTYNCPGCSLSSSLLYSPVTLPECHLSHTQLRWETPTGPQSRSPTVHPPARRAQQLQTAQIHPEAWLTFAGVGLRPREQDGVGGHLGGFRHQCRVLCRLGLWGPSVCPRQSGRRGCGPDGHRVSPPRGRPTWSSPTRLPGQNTEAQGVVHRAGRGVRSPHGLSAGPALTPGAHLSSLAVLWGLLGGGKGSSTHRQPQPRPRCAGPYLGGRCGRPRAARSPGSRRSGRRPRC